MTLLLILTMTCYLVGVSRGQCPLVCSCIGGNTRLICTGSTAAEVPDFPSSIRQTATDITLGNAITSIRTTDFQGFVNLGRLDLSGNRISLIEEGSFSTNIALDTLDLSNNDLREIPDNLFEQTTLFSLNLGGNLVSNISSLTFVGVQSGGTIELQDNVLRTIPEDAFSRVGNLLQLRLSGNPIRCDCELRWLPAFRDSFVGAGGITGECGVPENVNGVILQQVSEDQLLCNCTPPCVNGTCNMTVGECGCDDGYIGDVCNTSCPIGSFGAECAQNCICLPEFESSPCNNVDGTCNCLPGYTGPACDQECLDGFYGQGCLDVCHCDNGECNFITGFCSCLIGYVGVACNMVCPPLHYGQGCTEVCSCQIGNCHHITGNCSCPIGYHGVTCDHNCTEAADCADIGREECSLQTTEQTCGPCLGGYVGESDDGNSECILCSGAPNCAALNRAPCTTVVNTCSLCFQRHLTTPGHDGFSNELCFDPCIDGIMNFEETDIDCGGSICPPCNTNQACTAAEHCGSDTVCLGFYTHPSTLDFPFNVQDINTCVGSEQPGDSIAERFISALRGRENPLPDISQNSDFILETLEASVEREIQQQFNVQAPLESIVISDLVQEPGNPLYQTSIKFTKGTEGSVEQMIKNIHDGKLLGTILFNQKDRKVLHNL